MNYHAPCITSNLLTNTTGLPTINEKLRRRLRSPTESDKLHKILLQREQNHTRHGDQNPLP